MHSRLTALFVVALVAAGAQGASLQLGDPIPGELRAVDKRQGDAGTLVLLGAESCAPPLDVASLAGRLLAEDLRVIWIGPTRDELDGSALTLLPDARSSAAESLGATLLPEAYLFDRSGLLVYRGSLEAAEVAARALIERRPIAEPWVPVTAGCAGG